MPSQTVNTFGQSTSQGGGSIVPQFNGQGSMMPSVIQALPVPVQQPPKSLAVITADAAQKDLAQKQAAITGIQQTMTQNQSAQGAQKAAQTTATQPQTVQPNTTTPPVSQTASGPTDASLNTSQKIIQMLQMNPSAKLTAAQAQALGGLNIPGVHLNADGTYNVDAGVVVQAQNNPNANVATGGTGVTAPSTGDPSLDYINQQRTMLDQNADQAYQDYSAKVSQIQNGTFPLTQSQQAQINSMLNQFEALKASQLEANANYEGATKVLGIRSGRSRYAPELAHQELKGAIDEGISAIADIDAKAAEAVATLTNAFQTQNYEMINDQYTNLTKYMEQKNKTLDSMAQSVRDAIELQNSKLQMQKTQLDLETTQMNNIADAVFSTATNEDGTLNIEEIANAAELYGIDPAALYGAVNKMKLQHETETRDITKFEADLAQTKQATKTSAASEAKTYADIAKIKADMAAASATSLPGGQSTFVSQPAYSKLTAKQRTQADSLNNLVRTLGDFRTYLDQKTGFTGGNMFGGDSAVLETKLNSIIFAAAQAEGTGALQQADRQVIEKIIPNPTTLPGVLNAWAKGGKSGELAKIDDQIEKYTGNLASYGLVPVGTPQAPEPEPEKGGAFTPFGGLPQRQQQQTAPAIGTRTTIDGSEYESDGTEWVLVEE